MVPRNEIIDRYQMTTEVYRAAATHSPHGRIVLHRDSLDYRHYQYVARACEARRG